MFISFGRDFGRNHGEESPLSYDSDDEDHDGMNEDHDNTDGSLRHNGDDWDSENQIAFRFRDLLTTFLDVEPSEKNLNSITTILEESIFKCSQDEKDPAMTKFPNCVSGLIEAIDEEFFENVESRVEQENLENLSFLRALAVFSAFFQDKQPFLIKTLFQHVTEFDLKDPEKYLCFLFSVKLISQYFAEGDESTTNIETIADFLLLRLKLLSSVIISNPSLQTTEIYPGYKPPPFVVDQDHDQEHDRGHDHVAYQQVPRPTPEPWPLLKDLIPITPVFEGSSPDLTKQYSQSELLYMEFFCLLQALSEISRNDKVVPLLIQNDIISLIMSLAHDLKNQVFKMESAQLLSSVLSHKKLSCMFLEKGGLRFLVDLSSNQNLWLSICFCLSSLFSQTNINNLFSAQESHFAAALFSPTQERGASSPSVSLLSPLTLSVSSPSSSSTTSKPISLQIIEIALSFLQSKNREVREQASMFIHSCITSSFHFIRLFDEIGGPRKILSVLSSLYLDIISGDSKSEELPSRVLSPDQFLDATFLQGSRERNGLAMTPEEQNAEELASSGDDGHQHNDEADLVGESQVEHTDEADLVASDDSLDYDFENDEDDDNGDERSRGTYVRAPAFDLDDDDDDDDLRSDPDENEEEEEEHEGNEDSGSEEQENGDTDDEDEDEDEEEGDHNNFRVRHHHSWFPRSKNRDDSTDDTKSILAEYLLLILRDYFYHHTIKHSPKTKNMLELSVSSEIYLNLVESGDKSIANALRSIEKWQHIQEFLDAGGINLLMLLLYHVTNSALKVLILEILNPVSLLPFTHTKILKESYQRETGARILQLASTDKEMRNAVLRIFVNCTLSIDFELTLIKGMQSTSQPKNQRSHLFGTPATIGKQERCSVLSPFDISLDVSRSIIRRNDGINFLLNSIKFYDDQETLYLTVKVLLGLCRMGSSNISIDNRTSDTVQLLSSLRLPRILQSKFNNGLSTQKQNPFQKKFYDLCLEISSLITGKLITSFDSDQHTELDKSEKALIVARTKITYQKEELLQVVHQYLESMNLKETADTLLREANLRKLQPISHNTISGRSLQSSIDNDEIDEPPILDSIITQFLRDCHRRCPHPLEILPSFSILEPHRCSSSNSSEKMLFQSFLKTDIYGSLISREMTQRVAPRSGRKSIIQNLWTNLRPNNRQRIEVSPLVVPIDRHSILMTSRGEMEFSLYPLRESKELLPPCFHTSPVPIKHMSVTNDGRFCSTGDNTTFFWSVEDLRKGSESSSLYSASCSLVNFNVSCDQFAGLRLASNEHSQTPTLCLFCVENGSLIRELNVPVIERHFSILPRFSDDDQLLLFGMNLWDIRAKNPIHRFEKLNVRNNGDLRNSIFSPSNLEIIIDSCIWDIRTFKLLQTAKSLQDVKIQSSTSCGNIMLATDHQSIRIINPSDYGILHNFTSESLFGSSAIEATQLSILPGDDIIAAVQTDLDSNFLQFIEVGFTNDEGFDLDEEEDYNFDDIDDDDLDHDGTDDDDDDDDGLDF